LEDLVGQLGLTVHNSGVIPTFVGPRGSFFIDLALTTTSMEDMLQSWKAHDKISTSDHNIITFNIVYQNLDQSNYQQAN